MIVATAGHVDHGKSTLVRALTGMEPDRWAEERRRGMTIDLGYAWSGDLVFVDVPGHERFLGNALAGLGPTPAALVVVAADEGWREQTEEHVRALEMLGVEQVVAAVTRCDRADPARAAAQVRARLGVEAVAVSGVTGEGLPALRAALGNLRDDAPDHGRPRLWVDRVFSLPGAGTVVTGTLAGGRLRPDDEVEVGGRRTTIRGLQSLKQPVDVARPGTRVAVALRRIERREVRRGDALTYPGTYPGVTAVEVRTTDPGTLPREAMLHVGSAAVAVRVQGQGTRLRLARPLPLRPGDRGLLRNPGLLTGVVVEERPVRQPEVVARRKPVMIGGVALPDAAAVLATLPAPFAVRDARIALGTTRQVAVALLEALDTRGVTRREGDLRYVK